VGIAASLAKKGHEVIYVAEQEMRAERAELGWQVPYVEGIKLVIANQDSSVQTLVEDAAASSIHLCQGVRSNGYVAVAQNLLAERGLRQWALMETVDDSGWLGVLKRLAYQSIFRRQNQRFQGVLAIGQHTADWVAARGMPASRVFKFAYFLPDQPSQQNALPLEPGPFRFLFVGQFIERKCLGLLVNALASMPTRDFELVVVGTGPLEAALRAAAEEALPGSVRWLGRLPSHEVPAVMAQADCLVLPSRHDGWGAVISEALMVGTPVICSDACGAAEVVRASRTGGVFKRGDERGLRACLEKRMREGRLTDDARADLTTWSRSLGDQAGAAYLLEILAHHDGHQPRPLPPWLRPRMGEA
jgi:glycosyltransferase involved in cell wall biosynthesis